MPIFCPCQGNRVSRRWLLLRVAAALVVMCGLLPVVFSQTLARPGWVGSGMTPNVWWKHAFVYVIDLQDAKSGGLKGVAARMDTLQGLGVDAILLRGLQTGDDAGIDPAAGTMDDFDEVLQDASRHTQRVLVELRPKSASVDVSGVARFWLSRGVAGFRLVGDSTAQMAQLRAAAKGYVGERVMIGNAAQAGASASRGGHDYDGPQLVVDASIAVAPLDVAAIRMALERNDALTKAGGAVPMLATTDTAGQVAPELGKAVATLLLSSRSGTMIRAGQEGSGDSAEGQALSAWYRQVSGLERGNPTIRTGANTMLNHDSEGVVAWVRKPQIVSYNSPPVLLLCNMTDKPVTISLEADMKTLKFKGTFLKKLLRSDEGLGAQHLGAVTLAPYAVYVGELSY
jgi:hypothetical protein